MFSLFFVVQHEFVYHSDNIQNCTDVRFFYFALCL